MKFTNDIFNKNNENIINIEEKEKEINSINNNTDEAILNNFIKYFFLRVSESHSLMDPF